MILLNYPGLNLYLKDKYGKIPLDYSKHVVTAMQKTIKRAYRMERIKKIHHPYKNDYQHLTHKMKNVRQMVAINGISVFKRSSPIRNKSVDRATVEKFLSSGFVSTARPPRSRQINR